MTKSEFTKLIEQERRATVKNVLMELGLLKTTFTQAEVIKAYGRACYMKSLDYVRWQKKGESKSSQVICQRDEFENYLRRFDIELKSL